MAEYKYVMIRAGDFEFPIIFPDKLVHEDVAAAIMRLEPIRKIGDPAVVVGAGFLGSGSLDDVSVTSKDSESLGVGPRDNDDWVIRNLPISHGINTDPIDMDRLKSSSQRGVPVLGKEPRKPENARFSTQTRPLTGLAKLKARTGRSRL